MRSTLNEDMNEEMNGEMKAARIPVQESLGVRSSELYFVLQLFQEQEANA